MPLTRRGPGDRTKGLVIMRVLPRVVIAAAGGRSGKTTVTLGLIAALKGLGYEVQPFKKGPDYIDPAWLSLAAGRPCRNLDLFWMDGRQVRESVARGGGDIAVIEGAMGLFDGLDVRGSASTAEVARTLEAPVILVVDATRMTRSAAALVRGFAAFDPRVRVAGVIMNRVGGPRHQRLLRQAVEEYAGLPVLGCVPRSPDLAIPDRHLGLVPPAERRDALTRVLTAARAVEENVDLDEVLAIARSAGPLPLATDLERRAGRAVTIGVIRDRAFSFYYPENLEALERAGARLHFIDALSDRALPHLDGLYVGGGFPEVLAEELEANAPLRRLLRERIRAGLVTYAECGGLMYLGRRIYWQGSARSMVGALPYDVVMEERRQGHGYTVLEVVAENPFFSRGSTVRGHEFHHSRVVNLGREEVTLAFKVKRGAGVDGEADGILWGRALATYSHVHATAHPEWALNLVAAASAAPGVPLASGS